MPIYEYDCPVCGRIEAIQKVSDKPLKECPDCKEKGKQSKVTKVVSQASFHLKGSGWYKTDYGSNGSASSKSKSAGDSKDNTSSESKGESSDTKAKPAKACNPGCGCH